MSDGSVTIKTELDNNSIPQDVKELEGHLSQLPKETRKVADQVEKALNGIDVSEAEENISEPFERGADDIKESFTDMGSSAEANADQMADAIDDAAKEMSESFDEETLKVNKILDDSERSQRSKAMSIAAIYRQTGMEQSEAMKKAWAEIERASNSGAEKIADDLDDIGDKAKDTGDEVKDGLTGAFKDIFSANIVSDIAMQGLEKLGEIATDVAKQSVEAAAEIKASNAQFEQTFKGVEATAKKSLDNIAKQTGITATRMQNSYTSIFAFSKSVGADTEAALDISSRAMIAAADSAAYYDRSIEEATETLQSFLKGNFENDAALGIAATETTRNAKANELYAKSFQELSESQKVDVLLAMVEAGNQASGALGQAAREADSWTNVVGEATEAWRQLMGVLGEPILDNLAPAVQRVTEMLQKMVEVSASTELKKGLEDIAESFDNANEQFANTSAEIDFSAAKAEYYVEKLEELGKAGLETAESQEQYAAAVDALNALMPDLNLEISEQTGFVNKSKDAILAEVNALKQKAKFQAMQELYSEQCRLQAEATLRVKNAEKSLMDIEAERSALTKQLEDSMANMTEQERAQAEAAELTAQAFENAGIAGAGLEIALGGLKTEQDELRESIAALDTAEAELNAELEAANEQVGEYTSQNEVLDEVMAELEGQIDNTAEAQQESAVAAEEAAQAQQELIDRYNETREAARESIDSQIGLFQKLSLESDTTAEQIVSNWEKQQEAFVNYAQNLEKATEMGLDESLVKQLSDGTEQSMIYLQTLVDGTGTSVEEINTQFANLSAARDVAAAAMAGVQEEIDFAITGVGENITQVVTDAGNGATAALENTVIQIRTGFVEPVGEDVKNLGQNIEGTFETAANTVDENWKGKAQWFESNVKVPINTSIDEIGSKAISTWAEIETENREAWNRMVEDVEDAIDKMQKEIDSLKGKNVDVGVSSAYASYASAAEWATPVLASGTVIPTMAISSVQRSAAASADNGQILDCLERLIAKAEAQDNILEAVLNVTFAGELAPLVRLLYPEIQAEVRRKGTSLAEVHTE